MFEADRLLKVLIVDDIQSNVEFVTDVLELESLEVFGCFCGKDALKLASEKKPDLILLDISMPAMDGYEVCKKLKEDPTTKNIPIIFLTARVQKEDIVRGFEVGAVDYIIKPFNFTELISRVKTHLELKYKTEQLQQINHRLESMVEQRTNQILKINEELRNTNEQLVNANQKLSKLDKSKTEFVLHINHELRTPLNGIQGYVGLLAETIDDKQLTGHIESIEILTNRLIKLAELSLLFTELKTREQNIELQPINFSNSLKEAVDCREINQKNITLEIENFYNEIYVYAEPKLLSSCLSIVIDNAVKYSPSNSNINISVERANKEVHISVLDNGPGFSEKALAELFHFFTADNLQHNSYGFGVGLATAKIILDLIGGKIEIANRTEVGAVVKLKFQEYLQN